MIGDGGRFNVRMSVSRETLLREAPLLRSALRMLPSHFLSPFASFIYNTMKVKCKAQSGETEAKLDIYQVRHLFRTRQGRNLFSRNVLPERIDT